MPGLMPMPLLGRARGWISDRLFIGRAGKCFKRLKREQLRVVDFPRFYLVTKCPELAELSDWKLAAYLFHLHHTSIGPGDHLVVHFLRWLRG